MNDSKRSRDDTSATLGSCDIGAADGNHSQEDPMNRYRTAPAPVPWSSPIPAMTGKDDLDLAAYAKALGHPARVAILRILLEHGECVCGSIVERLPLAQATVSQHLKVLKDSGLIRGEIDPPRVCYCIDPDAVKRLKQLIATL